MQTEHRVVCIKILMGRQHCPAHAHGHFGIQEEVNFEVSEWADSLSMKDWLATNGSGYIQSNSYILN